VNAYDESLAKQLKEDIIHAVGTLQTYAGRIFTKCSLVRARRDFQVNLDLKLHPNRIQGRIKVV